MPNERAERRFPSFEAVAYDLARAKRLAAITNIGGAHGGVAFLCYKDGLAALKAAAIRDGLSWQEVEDAFVTLDSPNRAPVQPAGSL